jgi:hypothetical protein
MAVISINMPPWTARYAGPLGLNFPIPCCASHNDSHPISTRLISFGNEFDLSRSTKPWTCQLKVEFGQVHLLHQAPLLTFPCPRGNRKGLLQLTVPLSILSGSKPTALFPTSPSVTSAPRPTVTRNDAALRASSAAGRTTAHCRDCS